MCPCSLVLCILSLSSDPSQADSLSSIFLWVHSWKSLWASHVIWEREHSPVLTLRLSDLWFNSSICSFITSCSQVQSLRVRFILLSFVYNSSHDKHSHTLFSVINTSRSHMVTDNISIYTKSRCSIHLETESQEHVVVKWWSDHAKLYRHITAWRDTGRSKTYCKDLGKATCP